MWKNNFRINLSKSSVKAMQPTVYLQKYHWIEVLDFPLNNETTMLGK